MPALPRSFRGVKSALPYILRKSGYKWKPYDKLTSLPHSTANVDFTTMCADNLTRDRQSKTGAVM